MGAKVDKLFLELDGCPIVAHTWRRFDERRQSLIRRELEAILKSPGLSSNMFEVATKMLG